MPEWFIVNVADAPAVHHPNAGTYVPFESPESRFPEFGINIHVLRPGEPNAKYHAEAAQEDFLVLAGECRAIIDGEERPLRTWDFVHCPAGTEHVFVGAGTGPCAILMVGARGGGERSCNYPVNALAARFNASATQSTTLPQEAYSDWDNTFTSTQLAWPIG
jgi:uncharacterized cupin superfamily protein